MSWVVYMTERYIEHVTIKQLPCLHYYYYYYTVWTTTMVNIKKYAFTKIAAAAPVQDRVGDWLRVETAVCVGSDVLLSVN